MESERKSRYELFLEEEARAAQPTKRCSKCGEAKALSEFHQRSDRKDGRVSRCRVCLKRSKYRSEADRFWKGFYARTVRVGDCLEWVGQYSHGKPIYGWKRGHQSDSVRRVVYRLSCGELSDDMVVTTTCRNARCVRQAHLQKVTQEEFCIRLHNSAATGKKNGMVKHPERAHTAKLTADDVRTIRDLFARGESTYRELAEKYNIHYVHIGKIVRRKTWAHVQ